MRCLVALSDYPIRFVQDAVKNKVRLNRWSGLYIVELTFASMECVKHSQAKWARRAGSLSMYMKPSEAEVTCWSSRLIRFCL